MEDAYKGLLQIGSTALLVHQSNKSHTLGTPYTQKVPKVIGQRFQAEPDSLRK